MLFTFLWLANCVAPVFVAIQIGREMAGGLGALIGLGVGVLTGLGNFFGIKRLSRVVKGWVVRTNQQPRPAWVEPLLGLVYFGLLLWAIASGVLAAYITRFVIHLCVSKI